MRTTILTAVFTSIATTTLVGGITLLAWSAPTAAPPNNNVPPPVNVGPILQTKNGGLGVGGLAVAGDSIFSSGNGNTYLNFGNVSGTNGYGFRDNNGTLEYKNNGGAWAAFSSNSFADGTTQTTAASAGSSLTSFYGGNVPSGASYYYCFNCQNGSPDPSYAQAAMPRADVAQSLFVTVNAYPQPSTGTLVVTLRKNGANTPLSVTIPAGSPIGYVGSDTTHTVSFSAGDIIDIMATNNASASSCNFRGSMAM